MSPTVMRELKSIKQFIDAGYDREGGWYASMAWNYPGAKDDSRERRGERSNRIMRDPVRLLKLELPERRHYEEEEREHEREQAHGGKSKCPNCGEYAVKTRTVCTLGYPGHPGADYTALYECGNCDYKDM